MKGDMVTGGSPGRHFYEGGTFGSVVYTVVLMLEL